MNDKLNEYVDDVFAPYGGTKSVSELKEDLLTDVRKRFARMDKLTYAGLKALGAELSAVTVD